MDRSMHLAYKALILGLGPLGPLAPVGYWPLDEPAGATVAVNLGRAGPRLNGTYTAGNLSGPSLLARGSGASANLIPDVYVTGRGMNTAVGGVANPFAGEWSIEAWFLRRSVVKWGGIFSNNNPGLGAPLLTFVEWSNCVGINGAGLTTVNTSVDLGPASSNKVIYAVVTKTGGNTRGTANLTVYANLDRQWLPAATGTNSAWDFVPQDGFDIGRHAVAKHYFDGQIAEVAIYDRSLSYKEIQCHFACGSGTEA